MYDYRVQLAEGQIVRSMKLPLDSYSTETNAVVGACVLLEPSDEEQTGGRVGGGRENRQLGVTEADSRSGRTGSQ